MAWKTADGKTEASKLISQLATLINGMLNRATLLDLVRHFIVYEKSRKEDAATGLISITTVKKIAAYHQYYAVNAAVESTLRAADKAIAEAPETYHLPSVKSQPRGDRKAGVVWHTQGSGKSLSMVFYTGKIVLALDNPTVLVITDRNDLDDQLFDTFASCKQLLRQEPKQAENRQQLKELLRVNSGGVIFATIQKFQPDIPAHREEKREQGSVIDFFKADNLLKYQQTKEVNPPKQIENRGKPDAFYDFRQSQVSQKHQQQSSSQHGQTRRDIIAKQVGKKKAQAGLKK